MNFSLDALTATDMASAQPSRHARLLQAAQQFEGAMLTELMKPLNKASDVEGGTPDGEGGTMQSYGIEAMAGELARSGALGFAGRIVAAVEKTGSATLEKS